MMDEKQINIFDEIFSVLGDDDTDGLKVIGSILALPDEQFEIVKPVLLDSIEETFNTQEAKIAFAQMAIANNLRVEDFSLNLDDLVNAIDDLAADGMEISDSKKDFLKFICTTFINVLEESNMVPHRIISIPIEVCREGAKLPTYATKGSAAMDVYSPEEYVIGPGETVVIPTGLKVNIPLGYALLIQPRSGMSRKTKLRVANTPGLIDWDYHDEIGVIVENIDAPIKDVELEQSIGASILGAAPTLGNLYGSSFTIGKGERFAQMRLVEVPLVNWLPVSSIGNFEDDHGKGFGSTGTK